MRLSIPPATRATAETDKDDQRKNRLTGRELPAAVFLEG